MYAPDAQLIRRLSFIPVLVLVGCGSGDDIDLQDVSGKVTFAGKPVIYGSVEFVPDSAKKHKAPGGSAEIKDGLYDTAASGRGIVPGPYLVRITAYDQIPPPAPADETVEFKAPAPLFVGFTVETEMQGPTRDFDVPESARGYDIFKRGGMTSPRPGDP